MDNQDKIKFFNELQGSIDSLIRAGEMLKKLWTDGFWRLRGDEIELIEKEITEARMVLVILDEVKEKFKEIANK